MTGSFAKARIICVEVVLRIDLTWSVLRSAACAYGHSELELLYLI